jgi:hypothetical protein
VLGQQRAAICTQAERELRLLGAVEHAGLHRTPVGDDRGLGSVRGLGLLLRLCERGREGRRLLGLVAWRWHSPGFGGWGPRARLVRRSGGRRSWLRDRAQRHQARGAPARSRG